MKSHSTSVLIVGGGLSGTLTAIHLLHAATIKEGAITLLNPTPALGRGLAYHCHDEHLLLNVPAGNMSAFTERPSHFLDYCRRFDPSANASSFMPRRLYGEYLEHCLKEAMAAHPGKLHLIVGEALAVHKAHGQITVELASGQCLTTQQLVLALGHQPPLFPLSLSTQEQSLVIGAWDYARISRLPPDAPVLILGTGHTAVDALLRLTQENRSGPVWMISRRGLLPHAHRLSSQPAPAGLYPTYLDKPPLRARMLMRQLRQEITRQTREGVDWRDVLNELRAYTPTLWQAMPVVERKRFLRHAVAFWDIHRHRLAPTAAHRLHALLAAEKVQVMAARLRTVRKAHDQEWIVEIQQRQQTSTTPLKVAAIINCTGPSTVISSESAPLLQQLRKDGLVLPDTCGLGIETNHQYQVIDGQGEPVPGLWYVGPMLKARDWEATAVPELRVHAAKLAQHLAAHLAMTQNATGQHPHHHASA